MSLEKNIKKIRRFKNMTQGDVSKLLSISAQAYSKIESGETRLDTDRLRQIAEILGVTVQDIYEFDTNSNDMQIGQQKTITVVKEKATTPEFSCELVGKLEKIVEEQKAEILFLRNQITFLNNLLQKTNPNQY
jgi:transcriptional regulator with XRE-family HTH domain